MPNELFESLETQGKQKKSRSIFFNKIVLKARLITAIIRTNPIGIFRTLTKAFFIVTGFLFWVYTLGFWGCLSLLLFFIAYKSFYYISKFVESQTKLIHTIKNQSNG